MNVAVRIDNRRVKTSSIWLRGKEHKLTVSVRNTNGELVVLKPDDVLVRLGSNPVKCKTSTAAKELEFSLRLQGEESLSVRYEYEDAIVLTVFNYKRGLAWVCFASLGSALATVAVAFFMAYVRFEGVFLRLGESLLRLLGIVVGGAAVVVGTAALREALTARSWSPILNHRHRITGTSLCFVVVLLICRQCAVYANATGDMAEVGDTKDWSPQDLRFFGGIPKLPTPLCLEDVDGGPCTKEGSLASTLAGRAVGCRRWWPECRGVDEPSLQKNCKLVTFRKPTNRFQDEILELAFREKSPDAGIEELVFDERIGNAKPGVDLELVPEGTGEGLHFSLRPEASFERVQRIELYANSNRKIDLSLLGAAFRTTIDDAASGRKLGELFCKRGKGAIAQSLIAKTISRGMLRRFRVESSGVLISEWAAAESGSDTIAWCVPADEAPLVAELEFTTNFRPDGSWRVPLPPRLRQLTLRDAQGERIGTLRTDSVLETELQSFAFPADCPEYPRTINGEKVVWEPGEPRSAKSDRYFWLTTNANGHGILTTEFDVCKTELSCATSACECPSAVCSYNRQGARRCGGCNGSGTPASYDFKRMVIGRIPKYCKTPVMLCGG